AGCGWAGLRAAGCGWAGRRAAGCGWAALGSGSKSRLSRMSLAAAQFVSSTTLGTRIVVRTRIEGGVTDAVGYLRSVSDTGCMVETKRGLVVLALADVVAAKPVPPPPVPRAPRHPLAD
ncbi:hypothetical protein, partial [Cryobacterium sp. TMT2-4]|uniref:hypothetical protein n=1 Tax=Cryobacterium sp. TMT2-4 TaxID=1259254 RepID=UPI001F540DBF